MQLEVPAGSNITLEARSYWMDETESGSISAAAATFWSQHGRAELLHGRGGWGVEWDDILEDWDEEEYGRPPTDAEMIDLDDSEDCECVLQGVDFTVVSVTLPWSNAWHVEHHVQPSTQHVVMDHMLLRASMFPFIPSDVWVDRIMPHLLKVSVNLCTLDEIKNDSNAKQSRQHKEHTEVTISLSDLVRSGGVCEHSEAITWCSVDDMYPPQPAATWAQTTGWKCNASDYVSVDVKQHTTLEAIFREHLSARLAVNGTSETSDMFAADLYFGEDSLQFCGGRSKNCDFEITPPRA